MNLLEKFVNNIEDAVMKGPISSGVEFPRNIVGFYNYQEFDKVIRTVDQANLFTREENSKFFQMNEAIGQIQIANNDTHKYDNEQIQNRLNGVKPKMRQTAILSEEQVEVMCKSDALLVEMSERIKSLQNGTFEKDYPNAPEENDANRFGRDALMKDNLQIEHDLDLQVKGAEIESASGTILEMARELSIYKGRLADGRGIEKHIENEIGVNRANKVSFLQKMKADF